MTRICYMVCVHALFESRTLCVTILAENHEQRLNLKFLVKSKKFPTECFKLLTEEAYGGETAVT